MEHRMQTLTISCADHLYAVPQDRLVEMVAIDGESSAPGVENVNGAGVYRLRGALVPLVHLDDLVQVTRAARPARLLLAVLDAGGRRLGLVVDQVIANGEVEVQPLDHRVAAVGLFAGVTLVDDRAVLLLDVDGIADRVVAVDQKLSTAAHDGSDGSDGTARGLGGVGRRGDTSDTIEMLVLDVAAARVAVPLDVVTRLERTPAASLEVVGSREVVHHRGEILPVLRLDSGRPDLVGPDELLLLILAVEGCSAAFVVDEVVDIVDVPHDQPGALTGVGTSAAPGPRMLGDRIVDVLDVREAVLGARGVPLVAPPAPLLLEAS